ncbi:MAG: tRNA (N6-isopentenyl adenosine(37)-C2)-methylthiotransferase MiaB [Patescibacteria group bacterium]
MKKNKTYYIITIGCQMNKVDSERLAAYLEESGFRAAAALKRAGVIIINTCGIKQAAEDRAYGLVNQISRDNKTARIVVTGCLSRREDVQRRLKKSTLIFLPISEILRLPALLAGEKFKPHFSLDEVRLKEGEKYLDINPKHDSKFSAFVPIGNGCDNFCSYCVVPYARGREVYRPAADIIREVKSLVKHGYKEITIIAQNVNSYHDNKYNFTRLLKALIKIPGKFWLRFSSSHPKDMSDELIKVLGSSPKVCSHLHLAVQSGDDRILKAMNRRYTVKHYLSLIKKVRAAKPGIAITTDIIVGFPGESLAQFMNTVKLFKKVNFDLAYISPYSPRPGTASYQLEDSVSPAEKKKRVFKLNEVLKKSAGGNNNKYLNKVVEVLVEGKNKRGKYYGKTSSYQTVLINQPESIKTNKKNDLIGHFVKVRIDKALAFGLEGNFVK